MSTYISAIKNLSPVEVRKSCRLPCDAHTLRVRLTAKPVTLTYRDFTPWHVYRARGCLFLNYLYINLILRPGTDRQGPRGSPALFLSPDYVPYVLLWCGVLQGLPLKYSAPRS